MMRWWWRVMVAAGVAVWMAGVAWGGEDGVRGVIEEFGTYEVVEIADSETKNGAVVFGVADQRLLETTTRVPLERGLAFGYRFRLEGRPRKDEIVFVTDLPAAGGGEGREVVRFTRTCEQTAVNPFIGYWFDGLQDDAPGRYVLQVWADGEMLCEKSFEVYAPELDGAQ